MLVTSIVLDPACHDVRLVHFTVGTTDLDGLPDAVLAEDVLAYLSFVVMDKAIGRAHDILRRTIVLFQLEESRSLIHLLEIKNIVDIGTTKAVDALCVVAHHTDTLSLPSEQPDNLMLGIVGVLILIDENKLETFLILPPHLLILVQQEPGVEQEIVEIHRVGLPAAHLIGMVYLSQTPHPLSVVATSEAGIPRIGIGQNQRILGSTDTGTDGGGLILFVAQLHLADDAFYEALGVIGIVDGKVRGKAQQLALDAQDTAKNAVERAHPELGCLFGTHLAADTLLHLARSLVGKGEGQDVPWQIAMLQQVGNLVGEHTRLSAAGTGNDQRGSVTADDGLLLCGIQFREIYHRKTSKVSGFNIISIPLQKHKPQPTIEEGAQCHTGHPRCIAEHPRTKEGHETGHITYALHQQTIDQCHQLQANAEGKGQTMQERAGP